MLNPPAGAHDIMVSNATYTLMLAADYTGVAQSGQPNATGTNILGSGTTSITVSVSPTLARCWVVTGSINYLNSAPPGAVAPLVQRVYGSLYGVPLICDSNGSVPVGASNFTTTPNSGNPGSQGQTMIGVAFASA
jgi:hypothetical protein